MKGKKIKNKNGITLIALVITIIVMLILVSVTISIAVNGGLFNYAGKATGKMQNAINEEQQLTNGRIKVGNTWYDSIEDYLNNTPSIFQELPTPEIGIILSKQKEIIGVDDKLEIKAVTNPEGAKVTWESSDNEIATVEEGTVTGKKAGKVIITAKVTLEDGTEKQATCEIESKSRYSEKYNGDLAITHENGTAKIPKGFAVGISSDVNNEENGLVITDNVEKVGNNYYSTGNEFVWIPVTGYEKKGNPDEHGLYESFKTIFKRGYTASFNSSYTEPYTNGYSEEEKEYYDMMLSVQENGGFYIGRFEAGSTTPRTSSSAGTTTMVVKRDQYPYIYVGWGAAMNDYTSPVDSSGNGAVYLSKHMYDDQNVGVIPTLCYGVQWDAMCNFINDSTHDVTNSISWGNYSNSTLKNIERSQAQNYTSNAWTSSGTISTGKLLTTGADDSFAAKNIFDVAGNCYEWTMEAYSYSTPNRVFHGRQRLRQWL